jgi:cation diffusion facilitator family transporter
MSGVHVHGGVGESGRGVRRVLWITLLLNLLVSFGKILVGTVSGSLAMVADGYHSLIDASNNVIGLIVAAVAWAPPDPGHPYGHRKFETAATVGIAASLLVLAYEVVETALAQAGRAAPPPISALNWAVMLTTLAGNLFISWYEERAGRDLGSDYLVADAAHTRSDVYVSLGVLASFAGARAGLAWSDAVVAFAIGCVIAVQAARILIGAFHVLTDRAVIPAEVVLSLVRQVPGVLDCRDVRTRGRRDAVYVDLSVHVDGGLSLRAAHEIADSIEARLRAARPEVVDVVVHLEPAPPAGR